MDIGLLGGFVTASEHRDQRLATLDVVHTPTRPKVFLHIEHTFTYRLHIAWLRLAQPFTEAYPILPVLQAVEPVG